MFGSITPSEEELAIIKRTTGDSEQKVNSVVSGEEIVFFQNLIRKYLCLTMFLSMRSNWYQKRDQERKHTRRYQEIYFLIAGPRASQYLIIGAKCNAAIAGKFSPDIEDVKAVALPILRHRIVEYMAEAEGYNIEKIIQELL